MEMKSPGHICEKLAGAKSICNDMRGTTPPTYSG